MQRTGESLLAADLGDQLDLGGREVDVAGQQIQPSTRVRINTSSVGACGGTSRL